MRERISKLFTFIIVIVVLVGGILSAWPAYLRGRSLTMRDEELLQKIEEKKREIAVLKENQQRFKVDNEFLEMIARQNKRVSTGELVFIFGGNGR